MIYDGEGLKLTLQRRADALGEPVYVQLASSSTVDGHLQLEDQSAVIDCRSNTLDMRFATVVPRAESMLFVDCVLFISASQPQDQPTQQQAPDALDDVQLGPQFARNQTFVNTRIIVPCEVLSTPLSALSLRCATPATTVHISL